MIIDKINDKQINALTEGLVKGEYHLLLGAGASIGAKGGDNKLLPNSPELATQLLDDFGISLEGQTISLAQAYEAIESCNDKNGLNRERYFAYRFSRCKPSWQKVIAGIRWRRIWNLNVDDVIEQSYLNNTQALQTVEQLNWNSMYSDIDPSLNNVQVIHLHGYAASNPLEEDEPHLVFSILEYLQAASKRNAWHHVFGAQYLQEPFIIVGASLSDEYDLADFLRRGNKSQSYKGRPSIIVLKHIPTVFKDQFTKWGLIPIEAEASDFFNEVIIKAKKAEVRLSASVPGVHLTSLPTEARIFLQQFITVTTDTYLQQPINHDLYQGDDPLWIDIINDLDARFGIVDRLLDNVRSRDEKTQEVNLIYGTPGSGKSTILLRVGRDLISEGFAVYIFRGEERPNIESIIWWLRRNPNSAFLFDDFADFADDIGKLCEACRNRGIGILIIATIRDKRLVSVEYEVPRGFLKYGQEYRTEILSDNDIEAIVQKLTDQRRLGKLTGKFPEEQRRHFRKTANRQLFAAMADLEGGKGFISRVKKEYEADIDSESLRSLYGVICMSYAVGYPLPMGIACVAAGINPNDVNKAMGPSGKLYSVVLIDPRGLKPRHRIIANMVVQNALDLEKRYNLSLALAKALAPYITPTAISQRTLQYRIVSQLMNTEVVFSWMGRNLSATWYENLKQHYDWNARFWEQRALSELRLKHFPKARSYAEQAVDIRSDTITLNTLGFILMRMALDYHDAESSISHDLFWEAVSRLRESRELGHGRFPHSYSTFLSHALRFAKINYENQAIESRLSNEWNQWIKATYDAQACNTPNMIESINRYKYEWLSLAIVKD